ncbi:sulfatase-like hydrolase/transferase [Aromatoleum diolicum]|uniref:Sulfatase-like hydrolase/transferase n=2 Tax=Aromatoleum diolicum TaxID=75796 RepID=A0ABX1Q4T5_9RHOO|nr:sulfatase-like hydrolase/transferase [Aromatoleum diolicum]
MPPSRRPLVLSRYYVLLYVAVFAMIALFWSHTSTESLAARTFLFAATAGYAALYTAPLWLLSALLERFLPGRSDPGVWRTALLYGVAFLGGSIVLLGIYADYRLYELYQFHFNAFVWNLLTTPGGIDALGATEATERTLALQVALFPLGCVAVLVLLHRYAERGWTPSRRTIVVSAFTLFSVLAVEEFVYAYSTHTGQEDYLQAAETIPFHLHTGARKFFKRMGIEQSAVKELRLAGGTVDYPGHDLPATPVADRPNVVMLVGESFRWDLLSPEITPNLWQLSRQGTRFEQHYSGGNRTRMGMFSMFYGIYAPYWYSFERQRVAPALMNFLREHDYQLAIHTSQSFDYPELRHTVFAGVPEAQLQELKTGEPWRRDTQNIDDLIRKFDRRNPDKPFYGFMFFESTHAPYTFPEETVLRTDYIRELDYMKLDLRDNIDGIHARYINAAHHVDQQVGRLIEHLKRQKLLDKTVIMFTGDHGEEFMEKGRWGHGHGNTFPEEQIRVPLVLWLPGQTPQVVTHRTSHLQIAPTLLEYLGVTAPSRSYSSADTLQQPVENLVMGEYDYMGIGDGEHKITFPYTRSAFFRYAVFDANDHPVATEEGQKVIAEKQTLVDEVVRESRRFVR